MPRKPRLFLYLLVLLEGYVVLATELIALRQLLPFVGSGTEIVSIVVGGVLLPLAAGYHQGGHSPRLHIRRRLLRNILSALGILAIALALPFLEFFFAIAEGLHLPRLLQAALYVGIFIAYPVFLLAQTVPLVSHYFRRSSLSRHTGRMLFFSTAGSFLGSLLSTLVLMNVIGVHGTIIATLGLLALLALLLCTRRQWFDGAMALLFLLACAGLNHPSLMPGSGLLSNNAYNSVSIEEVRGEPGSALLRINRSNASKIAQNPVNEFPYVRYIEDIFLKPLRNTNQPRDILVLGAGGFTMGRSDTTNRYTYVDIDPALKPIAEKHFLKEPLTPNKKFEPISARAFLRSTAQHYDLVIIDTYSHVFSVPMETTTVEFLSAVKARLKPGGIVVANMIASPTFQDRFTIRYTNGFARVFPSYTRQVIDPYNPWFNTVSMVNLLYIYYDSPHSGERGFYTDDQNPYSLDR